MEKWVSFQLQLTLLIGLEIKRETKRGVLSNKKELIVPVVTALYGLIVPALIFIAFNAHNNVYLKGWAIPTATDIAFTLGILSLLGSRVPLSLKVLLTAIAIFDDIAAIAIIAVFYTSKLSLFSLLLALFLSVDINRIKLFQMSSSIGIPGDWFCAMGCRTKIRRSCNPGRNCDCHDNP